MESLDRFRQRLEDRFPGLTKSQQRIASYLLDNYDEAAFLPAAAVAERFGVSEATVVRFARAVGYAGYPELRGILQELFRQKASPAARLRRKLDDLKGDQRHLLTKVAEMEVQYLTEMLHGVRPADFDRAVEILLKARRIFVFGMGPARILADLARIRLQRFGIPVRSLTSSGRDVLEELLLLKRDDAVLAAGFLRATPELAAVLSHAGSLGCHTVFMTDTLGLAFKHKADAVLAARRGPVSTFHSMTVPMTILNALILAVAVARPKQSLDSINRLQELRAAYGLDVLGTRGPKQALER